MYKLENQSMHTHTDKQQVSYTSTERQVTLSAAHTEGQNLGGEASFQFTDNRPETVAQRKLHDMASTYTDQQGLPIQKKTNTTGLPDQLKSGIENLSGYNMDDVNVHYNSNKPAQLQAHAYAQGTDIHLAPGQDKHLPHEAWHVVQQKQGRVKPKVQLKGKVNINDDIALEKEADVMGAKASKTLKQNAPFAPVLIDSKIAYGNVQQLMGQNEKNRLHNKLDTLINKSKKYFETLFAKRRRQNASIDRLPLGIGRNQEGLGNKLRIGQYAESMARMMPSTEINNFNKNCKGIINEMLADAKIPPVKIKFEETPGMGEFNPKIWTINVNRKKIKKTLKKGDYKQLANIILHEARHAEQYWYYARKHPEDTAYLPACIKEKAAEMTQLNLGQKRLANKVAHNFRQSGQARNNKIITKLTKSRDNLNALTERAKEVLEEKNYTEYRTCIRQISGAMIKARYYYRLYRRQTMEIDAHAVGDAAGEAFEQIPIEMDMGIEKDQDIEVIDPFRQGGDMLFQKDADIEVVEMFPEEEDSVEL